MDHVYFNGQLLPRQDVVIPLDDRAFRFGDGLFETIAVYNNTPYQLAIHQDRMQAGLSALLIDTPIDLSLIATTLLSKQNLGDGFLRVMVSRGSGSKGYAPLCDAPSVYAELTPRAELQHKTRSLALSSYRKIPSTMLPAGHKLNALGLNSSLALMEAQEKNVDEALQLDQNGRISEASSGNIFWIDQGTLYTPSLACDCLNGTTRDAIMRLSHLRVQQVEFPLYSLEKAKAVFITNCNWGIASVDTLKPYNWQWPSDHADIEILKDAYAADIKAQCA